MAEARWERWGGWLAGAAAFALPLALYLRTVAPTVYGVDSAELTTGAYLLGIVHPPGSPAYLLIGHLFTWLPIGDVGYRVNLLSAVAAAGASFFLFTAVRRLTAATAIALLTSLTTAVTYYIWITAVAAELYAPSACVTAALIALALRWRATGSMRAFALFALLAGLGLGVHLASVLLLPGLALVALAPPRPAGHHTPTLLVVGVVVGLLGASVYLYVPLRALADLPLNPARDYWHVDLASLTGLWWMVSGGGFRHAFFAVPLGALPARAAHFAFLVWSNFLGLGALLGVLGVLDGLRRAPWVHGGLALMVVVHLAFFLSYRVGDTDVMDVPVLLVWAIWMGVGSAAAGDWIAARSGVPAGNLLGVAALGSLAGLLLLLNFRAVDVSRDRSARERGEALVGALAPGAVFVGSWSDLRLVEYLQQVEGQRHDIEPIDTFFITAAERATRIAAAMQTGRPVYVSTCHDLPDATLRCEYDSACDCHRLRAAAE